MMANETCGGSLGPIPRNESSRKESLALELSGGGDSREGEKALTAGQNKESEEVEYAERTREQSFLLFFLTSAPKTLSAGLYLVDVASSIVVLKEYYELYQYDTFDKRTSQYLKAPITAFALCLGFVILAHIATVVAFKLRLGPEEHPLRSAYFLPLVQFRRFVAGIWKNGPFGRASDIPESSETEALYAIMSAAIESGPQLALQFAIVVDVGSVLLSWNPSSLLILSMLSSFLSGAYNTGRAVMFHSTLRWTFTLNAVGVAAGVYVMGALLLRCTAIASVAVSVMVTKYDQRILMAVYFATLVLPMVYLNGLISLGPTENVWTSASQIRVLASCYMSITLGPLYPVIDGYARERNRHVKNSTIFYRLPMALALNLLIDVTTFSILTILRWSPCNFRRRVVVPSAPFLSSTLKCPRFVGFVLVGVALTIVSSMVFICLLAASIRETADDDRPLELDEEEQQQPSNPSA